MFEWKMNQKRFFDHKQITISWSFKNYISMYVFSNGNFTVTLILWISKLLLESGSGLFSESTYPRSNRGTS